ncbi:hypothetical protein LA080_007154 [Diaporthe eres]|nr:hypothetical protein LA080_007154 [Diaporthe eres]
MTTHIGHLYHVLMKTPPLAVKAHHATTLRGIKKLAKRHKIPSMVSKIGPSSSGLVYAESGDETALLRFEKDVRGMTNPKQRFVTIVPTMKAPVPEDRPIRPPGQRFVDVEGLTNFGTEMARRSLWDCTRPTSSSSRPTSASNPCDYLFADYEGMFAPGITLGCEYAGEVIEIGSAVTSGLKKGDRIAGLAIPSAGPMPNAGTFAEYILVKEMRHCGWLAKLSGMLVITTCSAANFGLVKARGADHAFDYHDTKDCVEGIRKITDGRLRLVFDCVGAFDSPQICAGAMASDGKGCLYNSLSLTPFSREDVRSIFTPGEAVLGEARQVRGEFIPGDEELFKAIQDFLRLSKHLFRIGKLRPPPTETLQGMEKILNVMEDPRKWKISGKKMVARI